MASETTEEKIISCFPSRRPTERRRHILLQTLIRHVGRVITQRHLLIEVWAPQHSEEGQYLRVYLAQLRRKLKSDPARPRHLPTGPGVRYRFVPE